MNYTLGVGVTMGDFRFDYSYKYDTNFSQFDTQYFSICFLGDEPEKSATVKESPVATDDNTTRMPPKTTRKW